MKDTQSGKSSIYPAISISVLALLVALWIFGGGRGKLVACLIGYSILGMMMIRAEIRYRNKNNVFSLYTKVVKKFLLTFCL